LGTTLSPDSCSQTASKGSQTHKAKIPNDYYDESHVTENLSPPEIDHQKGQQANVKGNEDAHGNGNLDEEEGAESGKKGLGEKLKKEIGKAIKRGE